MHVRSHVPFTAAGMPEAARPMTKPPRLNFPPAVRAVRLMGFVQPIHRITDYPLSLVQLVASEARDAGWHRRALGELADVL